MDANAKEQTTGVTRQRLSSCTTIKEPLLRDTPAPAPFQVDYSTLGRNWENVCASGQQQSPIDIVTSDLQPSSLDVGFDGLGLLGDFDN
jgi:hypothetical protein